MVSESELRRQMVEAFEGAPYPLDSPMDLLPALPDGVGTTFESGEFSMSIIDLNTELDSDFPYDSVDELVDHIIEELHDADKI
ncbi:MAG: MTH865 family protein [Natronomonas sp.]